MASTLAAVQGYAKAEANLAALYLQGQGVLKDIVTAHMWFNIASANGDSKAGKTRDIVERLMTRKQIAEATRRAEACIQSRYKSCD